MLTVPPKRDAPDTVNWVAELISPPKSMPPVREMLPKPRTPPTSPVKVVKPEPLVTVSERALTASLSTAPLKLTLLFVELNTRLPPLSVTSPW